MKADDLLRVTEAGLWCEAGGFHIDPWRPVERAVITHAHADHARWGSRAYLCAQPGLAVARRRLGEDARIRGVAYGEVLDLDGVRVSLHPAGHILGSAQVRVEHRGRVWVVSGDYKTEPDPTCHAFEPVRCDVFITECTFGLPVYRWPAQATVFEEIDAWWRANAEAGRTSVLLAYALGKAQRLLAGVHAEIGPILLHGAVAPLADAYRSAGVVLPDTQPATTEDARKHGGRALVIAPPSAAATPWIRRFEPAATAFASGWMRIRGTRRRRAVERGFTLSDHADWDGLLGAIAGTGAECIWATHGYTAPLVRWLRERGLDARAVETRFEGEGGGDAEAEAGAAEAGNGADASEAAR
jgi:putative mRNA 3-end processing factor